MALPHTLIIPFLNRFEEVIVFFFSHRKNLTIEINEQEFILFHNDWIVRPMVDIKSRTREVCERNRKEIDYDYPDNPSIIHRVTVDSLWVL